MIFRPSDMPLSSQSRMRVAPIACVALVLLSACSSQSVEAVPQPHKRHRVERQSPSPAPPPVCDPADCLWMATYDGPNSGSDYPHSLALGPAADRLFVSGLSAKSGDGPTGTTLAYSAADGIVAWQSAVPSGGGEIAAGSDRVYVGGTSVTALDAATGVKAWEATDIQGSKLELDGSETQLFVLSSPAPTSNPLLMALDAGTGTVRWVRHLGSRNLIPGWDIAVAPSGEIVYVTGGNNRGGVSGITTSAYNAGDGSRLWSTFDQPSSDADYGSGWTVAVSPDGRRVFAAGLKALAFTTIGYEARSGQAPLDRSPAPTRLVYGRRHVCRCERRSRVRNRSKGH